MSGAGFGRKQTADGAAQAERRAAFIAAERARATRDRSRAPGAGAAGSPPFTREKSIGTAYLLWLLLGTFSAHRFYLGFPMSGATQAALLPLSWALVVGGSLAAFLVMAGGFVWILVDAFLIPGLRSEANARIRRNAAAIFA